MSANELDPIKFFIHSLRYQLKYISQGLGISHLGQSKYVVQAKFMWLILTSRDLHDLGWPGPASFRPSLDLKIGPN